MHYHTERAGGGNVANNEKIYCCKVLYKCYNMLKNSGLQQRHWLRRGSPSSSVHRQAPQRPCGLGLGGHMMIMLMAHGNEHLPLGCLVQRADTGV